MTEQVLAPAMVSTLKCSGLIRRFGDRVAVDGMVCGLLAPDAGSVTVAGQPVHGARGLHGRELIGYVALYRAGEPAVPRLDVPDARGGAGPLVGTGTGILAGTMWPLGIVPAVRRTIGHFTPNAWAVDGSDDWRRDQLALEQGRDGWPLA